VSETGQLFDLLPTLYRVRDADHGRALEGLLQVLEREAGVVDRDIEQLYENWFIETCDPWVVPYIGDLLGVRRLHPVGPGAGSLRGYVANTLGYRRRKGTLSVLELLAYDVTGWRSKAVEFFQLLETTQYAKHVRPRNLRTPDLREMDALDLVDGPFERAAHTAEVRRIASGRGRYNLPNIGIYVWRLDSYPLEHATARRLGAPSEGRFTFSPLGLDAPLFNRPQTETAPVDLATELDMPAPLRRTALFDELEAVRQALADSASAPAAYFAGPPVLQVFTRADPGSDFAEVPSAELLVADLSLWQRPPEAKDYRPKGVDQGKPLPIAAAVDPQSGRMTFPSGHEPDGVEVSFAYGFSGDLGGGPYDRSGYIDRDFMRRVNWQRGVGREALPVPDEIVATLTEAIEAWNAQPPGTVGVISILDSRTYAKSPPTIQLKATSELLVVAADWPASPDRLVGDWVPTRKRPHVLGNLVVEGGTAAEDEEPGRLALEGLLVEGTVTVSAGDLGALRLADCTVVPSGTCLLVESAGSGGGDNGALEIDLERTICGGVELAAGVPELSIKTSIVQAAAAAVAAPDAAVRIEASTIIGSTTVRSLNADNSIFTAPVAAARRQIGCVRFCFVPRDPATSTPRRYRCQPDLALRNVDDPALKDVIEARVVPVFTTAAYGQPGYAQLGGRCPVEIRTGAENGAEMGAFMFLAQPQRRANLRAVLDEYLRLGLEAGVFPVT
jgi:hypothetical protein